MTIIGLDFNTPNRFVLVYLGKFGTITSNTVVYNKYDRGPFKGKYTGERVYEVYFTKSEKQMEYFTLLMDQELEYCTEARQELVEDVRIQLLNVLEMELQRIVRSRGVKRFC